jgi:hypothetical protein
MFYIYAINLIYIHLIKTQTKTILEIIKYLALIVYIIVQIFKRAVELQEENELTV